MKAMILAAGLGERLRPLTLNTPKPLIKVHHKYLIDYNLHALARASVSDVIINVHYHADQVRTALGDGDRYGLRIHYSDEKTLLNTGGGIFHALPLLGDQPFVVISCDIITDYPYHLLPKKISGLAHLVLVDNPPYHPNGDFSLEDHQVTLKNGPKFTFGNIAVYHPNLFKGCHEGSFPLVDVLIKAINAQQVTGEHYKGQWNNISTAEDIERLRIF